MLDILEFIFQDFFHWLGTVILIICIPFPFSHNSFINIWKEWNQKDQEDPQWGKEHPLVFNVRKVNGELQVEAGCQKIKTS